MGAFASLPGEFCLATTADCLLAGCFPVQPSECRQLFAVAQAGLKISPRRRFTQATRQLLFPPVRVTAKECDTTQCGDQPKPREMATQRQGWSGKDKHLSMDVAASTHAFVDGAITARSRVVSA